MAECKADFPSVLDSSEAGWAAGTSYSSFVVPNNFIIDRDGKVAEAFIGFMPNEPRGMKALERLGIK